jgi:integrase/recombinase XerD
MGSRGRVYNRTYTPELWEQVNSENKAILDDFLAEYRQRKKSKTTIEGYFQDLRIILIYILQKCNNKCILDLVKKDFRNLSIWLSDECQLSSNRVNRMKSSCNSLLTYCEEDDSYDYDVNFAKKVKGVPREAVKTDEDNFFFTYDEFIKVRDILVADGKLQLAVMWSIFFDSAGRRNEVFQIQKHGLLNGNKTNIVRGKRAKNFMLIYLDDTKELIRQYLEERGEDNIDSLWVKGKGDTKVSIKYEALYDRMCTCSEILAKVRGESTNIFPHTARHARIECLLNGQDPRIKDENGNNRKFTLDEVRMFAHHEDISTTNSYAKDHTEEKIDDMFGFGK